MGEKVELITIKVFETVKCKIKSAFSLEKSIIKGCKWAKVKELTNE